MQFNDSKKKRKIPKCAFCGSEMADISNLFILGEDVENWDDCKSGIRLIKKGSSACGGCLVDYIEDTERVPMTSPQIIYKYVDIENK